VYSVVTPQRIREKEVEWGWGIKRAMSTRGPKEETRKTGSEISASGRVPGSFLELATAQELATA
jgi:hypothetical protein